MNGLATIIEHASKNSVEAIELSAIVSKSRSKSDEKESWSEFNSDPKSLLLTDECVKHAGISIFPQMRFW